jgi:cytochrome c peroxidase
MYIKILHIIVFGSFLMSCSGTSEEPNPLKEESDGLFYQPENFPLPSYDFENNPVTKQGFELGRKLFYDGKLSRDGTISCAECHGQSYAFTHHGHTLSHGIDNRVGTRNAPPIQNSAFMKSFFWDGGVFDLDFFSVAPITNPLEMDEEVGNILQKLKNTEGYPELFEKAYGSKEITTERFLKALSQFMNSLVSANSKYDKYVRKEKGGGFTEQELAGLSTFKTKCASCHATDLFSDGSFRNNGLEIYERDPDLGRFLITEHETDKYKFKVPSLRNIEYTAPYMHDGRFINLSMVMEHYASGVEDSKTLDPELKRDTKLGIALTEEEKTNIKAFLKTLSDPTFISQPAYAAP